ncbi:MAG TPA: AAA family ATPase, partial [bacterium]|nr:AAA family ATPase [bacterium]
MQQQRQAHKPLAEKLRPMNLDDFTGQEHILGKDKILRRIIESDRIIPMIFWGPPGCGKTTLAKIIAEKTDSLFVFFSAVTGGIADARKIMATASENSKNGKKTILFVDEIHRFNKSQQDYFLPFVENGTITLLGATTENPSFQVNAPLLSRARVFHFRELTEDEIGIIIDKAIKKINADFEQFFPSLGCHSCEGMNLENRSRIKSGMTQKDIEVSIDKTAKHLISKLSEGDARDAYNALELAIIAATPKDGVITIDEELAEESIQQKFIRYDKGADGHYDAISALHKAIRASQIDASLHYLARMLEAGEDPLYVTRRLVRCASEDIGIVDPQALILAV